MKLVNLTPHVIRIRVNESNELVPLDSDIVIEPEEKPARLDAYEREVEPIDGIPVMLSVLGEIYDLPEPVEGVVYIVSFPVAQRLAGSRPDVVGPHTGPKGGAIRSPGMAAPFAVRKFQRF